MRKETQLVLEKHSDMLSGSISEYFKTLEKDEKPAIHIHLSSRFKEASSNDSEGKRASHENRTNNLLF